MLTASERVSSLPLNAATVVRRLTPKQTQLRLNVLPDVQVLTDK